jgi:hypothetical protein
MHPRRDAPHFPEADRQLLSKIWNSSNISAKLLNFSDNQARTNDIFQFSILLR